VSTSRPASDDDLPAPGTPVFVPSKRAAAGRSSIIREILRLTQDGAVLSLAGGIPAPDAVPAEDLRALAAELDATAFQYTPTEGYPPLHDLLAEQARAELGRDCGVLVTSGSQQALDLLGRVLLDPGDLVAMEHPGYLGAIQALEAYEPAFLPVPVDEHGMDTDILADALAQGARPKLVYTVATFSNPSGATLPAARRVALAGLAERYGFLIVEDDPYGHLRFHGDAIPPIASHSARVVRLGTASKTIAPGLRVGWAVGPADLIAALVRAKQAADLQASTLGQALTAALLARPGWMAAQVDRIVPIYRERATALAAALERHTGDAISVRPPEGGMFLWGTLRTGDSEALLPRAIAQGVAFVPGQAFAVPGGPPLGAGLRMSYSALDPGALDEAARRLGLALRA
jgi:2-aminoadipate transaminase